MENNILYKEALKKLESKDDFTVLDGLKILRNEGTINSVENIIRLLSKTKNDLVKNEILNFLRDIKTQEAASIIVTAIKNPEYDNILDTLVSSCWQSRLEFSDYLEDFIDVVIHKEYIVAYEAFTVVEYNISNVTKEKIESLILKLKMD